VTSSMAEAGTSRDRERDDRRRGDYDVSRDRREREREMDRDRDIYSDTRDREKDRPSRDRNLERKRDRSPPPRDRDRNRDSPPHRRHRKRSPTPSSDGSSSGHDSDADRKKKKRKHREGKDKEKEKDEDRKERKRKKKEKKEKKDKKKKKLGAVTEWGKYGVIAETDLYAKGQEFRSWLVEERMLNPETLSGPKEKEEFRNFMELFNTATLPHEKYYALEAYEKKMTAVRMGETIADPLADYNPRADEEALRRSFKRIPIAEDTYLNREQLESLRLVERERVEGAKMKRMGMETKLSMGVRYETQ